MASLDLDFELLGCEQHIADLTLRINQLLQKTLESGPHVLLASDEI